VKSLDRLLSISSAALGPHSKLDSIPKVDEDRALGEGLRTLLRCLNGFCAFESALHVFSARSGDEIDLNAWNSDVLWRFEYGDLAEGALC